MTPISDTHFSALIDGIKKDKLTIRVGTTKLIYILNRLFPRLAFKLVNPTKSGKPLQQLGPRAVSL